MTRPSPEACLRAALDSPELIAEFDRLTGANLSLRGSPLDLEIDRASGRQTHDMGAFVAFVHDCIWSRLPRTP